MTDNPEALFIHLRFVYAIQCEDCREYDIVDSFPTISHAGACRELYKAGWTVRNGKPLCPGCGRHVREDMASLEPGLHEQGQQ